MFKLSDRQKQILKIIIDEYTYSAQPVPSKLIVDKYLTNLSPQTIRIEMNLLEKYGLLEKTHTSSGRIPSINGYKYYELNILKLYLLITLLMNQLHLLSQFLNYQQWFNHLIQMLHWNDLI